MRAAFYLLVALLLCCKAIRAADSAEDGGPKKRQIYREQVLPHAGGRIPDTAFDTDRLFLNRLQTEGIAVPDGVVPETRHPHVTQYLHKSPRTVYRVALSSDARFTPEAGKYRYSEVPTVDTTYLYPAVASAHQLQQPKAPAHKKYLLATTAKPYYPRTTTPRPAPSYPVYRHFELHNPLLNQVRFQPTAKKAQLLHVTPTNGKLHTRLPYRTMSYQNFNLITAPVGAAPSGAHNSNDDDDVSATDDLILDVPTVKYGHSKSGSYKVQPHYGDKTGHLFNDFSQFFSDFDLHHSGSDTTFQYRPYGAAPSYEAAAN